MELALTPVGHLVVTQGVGKDAISFGDGEQKRLAKAFAAAGDGLFRLLAFRADEPRPTVAQRKQYARRELARMRKAGFKAEPVEIDGRKITHTFWGKAWCDHIESFHDFENRLPRGRRYARHGAVCHLGISEGSVVARVAGSEVYEVEIEVKPLGNRSTKKRVKKGVKKAKVATRSVKKKAVKKKSVKKKTGI